MTCKLVALNTSVRNVTHLTALTACALLFAFIVFWSVLTYVTSYIPAQTHARWNYDWVTCDAIVLLRLRSAESQGDVRKLAVSSTQCAHSFWHSWAEVNLEVYWHPSINPLALQLDIYSLAHHLCKLWIYYEPRRVTLGNTRHFVEEWTKMVRESLKI